MVWLDFERLRKDFHQIIRENQDKHPFYGFLSFLMEAETTPQIHVNVSGDFWKRKVQTLVIQFEGEDAVTFEMGELPSFDYEWFLKRPEMLLEHYSKDIQLESARSQYDKLQEKFDELSRNWQKRGGVFLRSYIEHNMTIDIKTLNVRRQRAVRHGALFHERLKELYKEYQETLCQSEIAPAPETSFPAPDLIEVELLTIIDDPDISELTKSDAQDTLDAYRQETVNVKKKPKEENAQLAIQTIRRYYTKNERKESDSK